MTLASKATQPHKLGGAGEAGGVKAKANKKLLDKEILQPTSRGSLHLTQVSDRRGPASRVLSEAASVL